LGDLTAAVGERQVLEAAVADVNHLLQPVEGVGVLIDGSKNSWIVFWID